MFRIDNSTAQPSLEAPTQPGAPGYFTNGDPLTGEQPTVVDADWMNAVQEEIAYVIETSGLVLSKTDRTQLFQALQRLTRIRLTQPTTFYVATNGSDNNNGASPSTPFASLTAAYNYVRDRIDGNGFPITIKMADGTYAAAVLQYPVVGASVRIVGDVNDNTKVVISNPNGPALMVLQNASVIFDSILVRAVGAGSADYTQGGCGIIASASAYVNYTNICFDQCQLFHLYADYNSGLAPTGAGQPLTIIGGGAAHMYASNGSAIEGSDANYDILNNPLFTSAFAIATMNSNLGFHNTSFVGTARGSRYAASMNSVINTVTGNVNFLPGDAAGTVASGGIYE
jgi:hypothetical protein